MKQVKCKSGIIGWQEKLQKAYTDFEDFKSWCRIYGIHKRLGYASMKSCWESNPTIQGSTNPSDLAQVYFHVVKGKKGLRVKDVAEKYCENVKGSIVSFVKKSFADEYILQNIYPSKWQ